MFELRMRFKLERINRGESQKNINKRMTYLRHVLLRQLRYNGYMDCRRCILQTSQSRQFCPGQRKTDRGRSATNKQLLSGPVGRVQIGFVYHLVSQIFMLNNKNIEVR